MAAAQSSAVHELATSADDQVLHPAWWHELSAQAEAPGLAAVARVQAIPQRTIVQSNCSVRAFTLTLRSGAHLDVVLKHVDLSRNTCASCCRANCMSSVLHEFSVTWAHSGVLHALKSVPRGLASTTAHIVAIRTASWLTVDPAHRRERDCTQVPRRGAQGAQPTQLSGGAHLLRQLRATRMRRWRGCAQAARSVVERGAHSGPARRGGSAQLVRACLGRIARATERRGAAWAGAGTSVYGRLTVCSRYACAQACINCVRCRDL